jgi:hypothetical protein
MSVKGQEKLILNMDLVKIPFAVVIVLRILVLVRMLVGEPKMLVLDFQLLVEHDTK